MSTRSNVKIIGHDGKSLFLYRHCDGYLKEAGAVALEVAKDCQSQYGTSDSAFWLDVAHIANQFLKRCYGKTNFRPAHPIYELTNDWHGDIAHLYIIDASANPVKIQYAVHPAHSTTFTNPENWVLQTHTIQSFEELVAADKD